jgi:hypothetical protein
MTLQAAMADPGTLAVSALCAISICFAAINFGGGEERARMRSFVRRNKTTTLLATALLWVFVVQAQKDPGHTNPPPSSAKGFIRLYWHAPDGRLVPFDHGVEVRP